MLYIQAEKRFKYDQGISGILRELPLEDWEGDLNYIITSIISTVWAVEPRYKTIARITGALENVKQEFYRRIATPYENMKLAMEGDVYEGEEVLFRR